MIIKTTSLSLHDYKDVIAKKFHFKFRCPIFCSPNIPVFILFFTNYDMGGLMQVTVVIN